MYRFGSVQHSVKTHSESDVAIILASQCSGSTWIRRALNEIDGISFNGETMIDYSRMSTDEKSLVSWDVYLNSLQHAFPDAKAQKIRGFKLMYDQVPHHLLHEFAAWLNSNRVHVIHLRRSALLQMTSHVQKVRRGGISHVSDRKMLDSLDLSKIHISIEKLPYIVSLEQKQTQMSNFLQVHAPLAPVFDVKYEFLDGIHKTKWFTAILGFMGVFGSESPSNQVLKVGGRTCEERVSNISYPNYGELYGSSLAVICAGLHSESLHHAINFRKTRDLIAIQKKLGYTYIPEKNGLCPFTSKPCPLKDFLA